MVPVLKISDLRVTIPSDEGPAKILDHISLTIERGRIVGVVGESGCGKSTLLKSILAILPHRAVVESGTIELEGENLLAFYESELATQVRGRRIGFIPQDPYLALNPVFTVGEQLLEIMRDSADPEPDSRRKRSAERASHRAQLIELLRRVQMPDPEDALDRYPHEFSGGQRQRLLITGALACRPQLILADEPTTALDLTTQLQILRLLRDLVDEFGVSMLFITHDLGVVAQLCDEVNVIYAGQCVEAGTTRNVLRSPKHPYTRALIASHPRNARGFAGIPGAVPSPLNPPPGCRFGPRCNEFQESCAARSVKLLPYGTDHSVNCRLFETEALAE